MKKKYLITLLLTINSMSILKAQPFNATDAGAKSFNEQKIIFTGGVILETNVSDFIHSGIDDSQSKMKLGFSAGGFLDLGISKAFPYKERYYSTIKIPILNGAVKKANTAIGEWKFLSMQCTTIIFQRPTAYTSA